MPVPLPRHDDSIGRSAGTGRALETRGGPGARRRASGVRRDATRPEALSGPGAGGDRAVLSDRTPFRRRTVVFQAAAVLALLPLLGLSAAPAAEAAGTGVRVGEINVIADHSGRCLAAESSGLIAGTPVVQADCTGQPGVDWRLEESAAGGGSVQLVDANSGRCLETAGAAVGSAARLADCAGQTAASFRVVDRTNHVWLQPLLSSPAKCLGITGGSHAPGAAVRVAECSGQSGTAFRQRVPRSGNDTAGELGAVTRVNLDGAGAQTPGVNSWRGSSLSADGRHVAFDSYTDNLVPGDVNAARDIFVRDHAAGTIQRVNVPNGTARSAPSTASRPAASKPATRAAAEETSAREDAAPKTSSAKTAAGAVPGPRSAPENFLGRPSISGDGRFVAFDSNEALVPSDTNNDYDVYVRDRKNGATELISRSATSQPGNGMSSVPAISADGRFVAFTTFADNLVPGDTNGQRDVLVRDRKLGTIERVSVATGGTQSNGRSEDLAISADGRFVAFDSVATNLVTGDTNATYDVFVRDRQTATTQRVSVGAGGAQGSGSSPSISADGRFVSFASGATNLVTGDTNAVTDVFVRDRQTSTTERVNVSVGGQQALHSSYVSDISADGRFVAFVSSADNLAPYDTNGVDDAFIKDRQTGEVVRPAVDADGVQGNGHTRGAGISANGDFVVFESSATNLVPGDTNAAADLFVRPRPHTP